MSTLTLDVGLANKLKVAFARNGWTPELIDAACEGDKLGQFREVLLGYATINDVEHVIDCDALPVVYNDGIVVEHQKGGMLSWSRKAQKDALYLSRRQLGNKRIKGEDLRKELSAGNVPVLNATVLDYLLANPHLIPGEWKGKRVFFWGTIFRYKSGEEYVRCLAFDSVRGPVKQWTCENWTVNKYSFRYGCPTAVRAS